MKLKNILFVSTFILTLASCTSEVEETVSSQPVPLQIQVEIENSSRAANVADNEFKEGESILIAYDLLNGRGADYTRATYTNGQWAFEEEIKFDNKLEIQAFYPANTKGYNGGSGISFIKTIEAGVNHLESGFVNVSTDNPVAKLTFKHLMARVRIEVVNHDAIPLNSISLDGNNIYNFTTEMEGANYDFSGNYYDIVPIVISNSAPSNNELQVIDVPLIPGSQGNATLTLNYEDGKSYRTELNFPKLEKGHYYIVPVTISKGEEGNDDPEAFTITTSIQDWTEQNMNELEITNKNVVE